MKYPAPKQAEQRNQHNHRPIDSSGHAECCGSLGKTAIVPQGVLVNCTKEAGPGLRPEDGWLIWEPRKPRVVSAGRGYQPRHFISAPLGSL